MSQRVKNKKVQNSNEFFKDLARGHEKSKINPLTWRDVTWRGFDSICVCPLIDRGQQPMKMHTEATLLYKYNVIQQRQIQ